MGSRFRTGRREAAVVALLFAGRTLLITGDRVPVSLFHAAVRHSGVHKLLSVSRISQALVELQCMRLSVQEESVDAF